MAKTPEQIIIDGYEGSRQHNKTFKSWPVDTFIGYVTGMIHLQNLNVCLSASEWEALVRKLVEEEKI